MAKRDTQADKIRLAIADLTSTNSFGTGRMTEKEAKAFARRIGSSAWWRKNRRIEATLVLTTGVERLEFTPNTPSGVASPGCGHNAFVAVEPENLTALQILHKVAHFTSEPRPGTVPHGPEFAKAYVEAVRKFLGPEAKLAIVAAFKARGVQYIYQNSNAREAAKHRAARASVIALAKELANS